MQEKPASVSVGARQVGEAHEAGERRSRWAWVEASVWTDRMLAALENGVKGGVWFSINAGQTHTLQTRACIR